MEDKREHSVDELITAENEEKDKKKKQQNVKPWVGFGLDGAAARFDDYFGIDFIGEPISPIIALIKDYLSKGTRVKIFTNRISHDDEEVNRRAAAYIRRWCVEHIGQELEITNKIDLNTICIYDINVKEVVLNTGEIR